MGVWLVIARNNTLARAGFELAHASGVFRLAERRAAGTGAILRFERVRPRSTAVFQPLRHEEITPRFLERMIRALQRWKFEFVSIAEARARAQRPRGKTRFVALTFDGADRDFLKHAYPVLQRFEVPFSLYVPTGFVDNIAQAWWLALEAVVARAPRIVLVMKGEERRFRAESAEQKYQVFDVLYGWMLTLPPDDLSVAIADLCNRYGVELKAVSRDIAMGWPDILKLAEDSRAVIGSATVSYPVLANIAGPVALREMKMGRTILETSLERTCDEFAYPFGARDAFSRRDVLLAQEASFASAVCARPGLVVPGKTDPMCLPRITWRARSGSMRALRVVLSGLTMRREKRTSAVPEEFAS